MALAEWMQESPCLSRPSIGAMLGLVMLQNSHLQNSTLHTALLIGNVHCEGKAPPDGCDLQRVAE